MTGRPLLPAVVAPWAAYVIARDYGDALERHAAALEASAATAVVGRQLRQAVGLLRESGRQQIEAHRAAAGSASGTTELPKRVVEASSVSPPADRLSAAEVAEMLRVSRRYVTKLCGDGRLSATKEGRDWRIERSSVEDHETFLGRRRSA